MTKKPSRGAMIELGRRGGYATKASAGADPLYYRRIGALGGAASKGVVRTRRQPDEPTVDAPPLPRATKDVLAELNALRKRA